MLIWDIAVAIWLLVFIAMDAKRGLIRALGGLIITILGYVAGFFAVALYGAQMQALLEAKLSTGSALLETALGNVMLFLLAFVAVRVLGFLVISILNRIGRLPGLKQLNRLGGGAIGFFRGILMLLLLGQVLVLAGLTPGAEVLSSTMVAKYFFTGFL